MLVARHARGLVPLVAGLVLALGGCGSGEEEPELIDRDLVTLMPDDGSAAPSPAASPPPPDRTAPPSDRPAPTSIEPAAVASRAAAEAVPDSTVTVVERTDGGWEVTLVGRTGAETVVALNEGAPSVVRLSVDDADPDDRAEALRLVTGARLDVAQAVSRARTVVPDSTVVKVELDEEDGVIRYELDFDDEDDVLVDARTGSVSRED